MLLGEGPPPAAEDVAEQIARLQEVAKCPDAEIRPTFLNLL